MVAHLELPPNIKCKWVLIITPSLLYIILTHYQLYILNVDIPKKYGYCMWNCGDSVFRVYINVCVRTFIDIYISRTYFSHTFSYLLIFTLSFQVVGCIFGMAIVTIRIDENSIISRQGIPFSQVELITFLFGMIDNSLQALQRENKSSVCGIKILFQYSVEFVFYSYIQVGVWKKEEEIICN